MIFNHTFKTARPLLWKIERHFKLNLLVVSDYHKAMALYDCILVIAQQQFKKTGYEIDFDNRVEWSTIMAELLNQKTNN